MLKAKFFLDAELVLLPVTQELATREQEAREILKNIEETKLLVMENKEKFYRTQSRISRTIDPVKLAILHRNRDILYKKAFTGKKSLQVDDALDIVQRLRDTSGRVVRAYNVIFCKCPADKCRGYIEYASMECGFCRVKVCKICTSLLKPEEEHKCKEEEIASAEAIRKDTKPCPKCSSPIFKIEGCDQMWCTQCHFAFSWNTGEEDGDVVVHNPHFYEWQRQQNNGVIPRVRGDNVLVEEIKYYEKLKHYKEGTHKTKLLFFYRFTQYSKPSYNMPQDANNTDLRIQYILNDISLEQLTEQVLKRGMERLEKIEIYQIFEAFFKSSNEILLGDSRFITKIDRLIDFINGQFVVISKKYFSKPYTIHYNEYDGYSVV